MEIFAIVVGAASVLSAIVTVVWAVGKISTATEVQKETIRGLKYSLDQLRSEIHKLNDKLDYHGERLTRVETQLGKI